ncbi:MAG: hypothetical protein IT181_10100 [Acidobacteria bacterium]|nr:hypothetical protein [Acidobacteriota bacterium]
MATQLLIVHGYSDGSTSFTALGDFLVAQGLYGAHQVHYLDYSSMDDEATFRDFADKLDADYRTRFAGERIDVVCHSTGSLVVRGWLALHEGRSRRRGLNEPCPVDRLLCFAPANFGSDLARMGQSFLGKFRSTFFNSRSHKEDFMESGAAVLQGLEPASPFQWELSWDCDLHGDHTYFSDARPEEQRCYPFVLAAGEAYAGMQAKVIKQRAMPGTDGTVRIAGTSLNSRACSLDFRQAGPALLWWKNQRFERMPFAVFSGVNHGSIIDPECAGFANPDGPGGVATSILRAATTADSYRQWVTQFDALSDTHHARLPSERQAKFQQFFFRVRDDIDQAVEDYFVDFHVAGPTGEPHAALTEQFDELFETQVHVHSKAKSHRVFWMNCSELATFDAALRATGARLMLEISGKSTLPDVRYDVSTFVAYDPAVPLAPGAPVLMAPNTTTLVDVILNRAQTDRLLSIGGGQPVAKSRSFAPEPAPAVTPERTGRAVLAKPADAPN